MNRRAFLRKSTQAVGAMITARGSATSRTQGPLAGPAEAGKPNVIWLLGDQHRAHALGCNGDPHVRSPNIDNLSGLGVNFSAAVSGFPLCCPFRGSLLSSRYPHHCVPGHEYPLPAGQKTIVDVLKDAGYRTAYFGKWHLDGFKESAGRAAMHIVPPQRRRGFETWAAYHDNDSQWDSWVHGGIGKDAFHYRLPGYETDELANLLIKYIRERGEEAKAGKASPFFAVLSVQPPHDPYVAPESFMRNYSGAQLQLRLNVPPVKAVQETARRDLAGYYAMIENLDWNVGRIRKALEDAGLSFTTHILFFSDHGDMHGSHGQYRKPFPYEEAIRIPLIIGGERPRYGGRSYGRFPLLLNHVDIAPTTLGLCGIRKPDWMEGTDYSHYRIQKPASVTEPDSAFLQCVIPVGLGINKPWRGVVTKEGWKYVCLENISWLMFNLNEDPYELVNVAHNYRYRAERRKLIDRLRQWTTDTGDKFPVPDD